MYQPVLATLGYILSPDRSQVLMIHRNKRLDDYHLGKYNGLGGRLEADEDIVSGIKREVEEESGLIVEEAILRGTISWPGFGKHGEGYFGFIFRIERWQGTPHEGNHEGTLEWISLDALLTLPMWPSDRYFLPLVFDQDPRPFHGIMPWVNHEAQSWSYTR